MDKESQYTKVYHVTHIEIVWYFTTCVQLVVLIIIIETSKVSVLTSLPNKVSKNLTLVKDYVIKVPVFYDLDLL